MTLDFSVVVPVRNGLATLPEVLSSLARQRGGISFETLVVDDGSTDGTADWLRAGSRTRGLTTLKSPSHGAAAARNEGIRVARGHRIALLGADTVPAEDWLLAHQAAHEANSVHGYEHAVLGLIRPHRRLARTPFLEVIHRNGLQFGYPLIEDPHDLPFNFFYSSNVSLSRELLLRHPFDTSFGDSAWEDVELGYRLQKNGVRTVYAADAVVEHNHRMTLPSFAARQQRSGFSAVVLFRLHPELGELVGLGPAGPPPPLSPPRQRILRLLTRTTGWLPWRATRLWEAILGHHYLIGLNRGWRELRSGVGGAEPSHGRRSGD